MSLFHSNHDKRQGSVMFNIMRYCSNVTNQAMKILKRPHEKEAYENPPKRSKNTHKSVIDDEIRDESHRWSRNKFALALFDQIESEWLHGLESNETTLTVIKITAHLAENTIMQREVMKFTRDLEKLYDVNRYDEKDDIVCTVDDVTKEDDVLNHKQRLLLLINPKKRVSTGDLHKMFSKLTKDDIRVGLCIVNQTTIPEEEMEPPLPSGVFFHVLSGRPQVVPSRRSIINKRSVTVKDEWTQTEDRGRNLFINMKSGSGNESSCGKIKKMISQTNFIQDEFVNQKEQELVSRAEADEFETGLYINNKLASDMAVLPTVCNRRNSDDDKCFLESVNNKSDLEELEAIFKDEDIFTELIDLPDIDTEDGDELITNGIIDGDFTVPDWINSPPLLTAENVIKEENKSPESGGSEEPVTTTSVPESENVSQVEEPVNDILMDITSDDEAITADDEIVLNSPGDVKLIQSVDENNTVYGMLCEFEDDDD